MQAAAQHARNGQRKDEAGEGEEKIGDAHEDRVEGSADPRGENADDRADDGDDGDEQQGRENAGLRADDDAGEHITSIAIRAEHVLGAGRHFGDGQILHIGIIGAELLAEDGREQEQNRKRAEEDESGLEGITAQLLHADSRFPVQSCTTPSLILGSMAWYSRSVIRFTST